MSFMIQFRHGSEKMKRKLYRSETDRKICGVCGGIGEYFNVDSTIIRLLWIFLAFTYGSGILIYIIAALIIPSESEVEMIIKKKKDKKD